MKIDGTTEQDNVQSTESENGQTSAEKSSNSNYGEIIGQYKVPNSPLTIVTVEGGEFIGIGNRRITDILKNGVAEEMIAMRDWDLIIAIVTQTVSATLEAIAKEQTTLGNNKTNENE